MRFPFFIAWRYLFSKKNTNVINIISGIAIAVFTIGTAVMIIILSFLNGLEGLVKDMNNSFDPEIKITSMHSKGFEPDSIIRHLEEIEGIRYISKTLEDNVVVRYGNAQEIAKVKGVEAEFVQQKGLDSLLIEGELSLSSDIGNNAIFGGGIGANLNINTDNPSKQAVLYVPAKGVTYSQLNPEASLNSVYIRPVGVILITEDGDKDIIIIPLAASQELFQSKKRISALELGVHSGYEVTEIQQKIKEAIGHGFDIRNRDQQNEAAYRVFTTEKWATFAILTLVLMIAAFNTIGALTMLVLEKSKDIQILRSMGAERLTIQRIFLAEGMLITIIGILLGTALGALFVFLQKSYGLISLEGSFVDFFPIEIRLADLAIIALIILVLGFSASIYPSLKSAQTRSNRV